MEGGERLDEGGEGFGEGVDCKGESESEREGKEKSDAKAIQI